MNISDVNRAIAKLKPTLKMVGWNPDGFKVGICSVLPWAELVVHAANIDCTQNQWPESHRIVVNRAAGCSATPPNTVVPH